MTLYARDILNGDLPGPYTDRDATACLIPTELLERPDIDTVSAAAALNVPADALRDAHKRLHAQPPITRRRFPRREPTHRLPSEAGLDVRS